MLLVADNGKDFEADVHLLLSAWVWLSDPLAEPMASFFPFKLTFVANGSYVKICFAAGNGL